MQTRKFAAVVGLAVAGMFLAIALLLGAGRSHAQAAQASAACPTFRVLGNDRIGPAVLPKGTYSIKVFKNFSCADASSHFTRFLQDYDGKLPSGWQVQAISKGKASFTRNGRRYFSVSLGGSGGGGGGGGGGGHNPSLGKLCPGSFQVLHNDRIGPLKFPKGGYKFYIPKGSKIGCNQASKLFAKFLDRPSGDLPNQWKIKGETATFYKKNSPTTRRFQVDPGA